MTAHRGGYSPGDDSRLRPYDAPPGIVWLLGFFVFGFFLLAAVLHNQSTRPIPGHNERHHMRITNAAAKLLAAIANQPELFTTTSDILRAGTFVALVDGFVPAEPTITKDNPTAAEVAAFRADHKMWAGTMTDIDVPSKTSATLKTAVGKMVEKGKLGADATVVAMLTAIGFSDE